MSLFVTPLLKDKSKYRGLKFSAAHTLAIKNQPECRSVKNPPCEFQFPTVGKTLNVRLERLHGKDVFCPCAKWKSGDFVFPEEMQCVRNGSNASGVPIFVFSPAPPVDEDVGSGDDYEDDKDSEGEEEDDDEEDPDELFITQKLKERSLYRGLKFLPEETKLIEEQLGVNKRCQFDFPSGVSLRVHFNRRRVFYPRSPSEWKREWFVFEELLCKRCGLNNEGDPLFVFSVAEVHVADDAGEEDAAEEDVEEAETDQKEEKAAEEEDVNDTGGGKTSADEKEDEDVAGLGGGKEPVNADDKGEAADEDNAAGVESELDDKAKPAIEDSGEGDAKTFR